MKGIWNKSTPSKPIILFDLEADGLDPTKIHCVSYCEYIPKREPNIITITDVEDMKELFSRDVIFIGHNIMLWDFPKAIEKLLGIVKTEDIIDSLWISRYICPNRAKHGLEQWGIDMGIPKPVIEDWEFNEDKENIIKYYEGLEGK